MLLMLFLLDPFTNPKVLQQTLASKPQCTMFPSMRRSPSSCPRVSWFAHEFSPWVGLIPKSLPSRTQPTNHPKSWRPNQPTPLGQSSPWKLLPWCLGRFCSSLQKSPTQVFDACCLSRSFWDSHSLSAQSVSQSVCPMEQGRRRGGWTLDSEHTD